MPRRPQAHLLLPGPHRQPRVSAGEGALSFVCGKPLPVVRLAALHIAPAFCIRALCRSCLCALQCICCCCCCLRLLLLLVLLRARRRLTRPSPFARAAAGATGCCWRWWCAAWGSTSGPLGLRNARLDGAEGSGSRKFPLVPTPYPHTSPGLLAASPAPWTTPSAPPGAAGCLTSREGTPCSVAATCGERAALLWGRARRRALLRKCRQRPWPASSTFAHLPQFTHPPAQGGVRPPVPRLHRPLHRAAAGRQAGAARSVQRERHHRRQPGGAGAAAAGRRRRGGPAAAAAGGGYRPLERAHLRCGWAGQAAFGSQLRLPACSTFALQPYTAFPVRPLPPPSVNNGVYKCGFSTQQAGFSRAEGELFAALDELEAVLRSASQLVQPASSAAPALRLLKQY